MDISDLKLQKKGCLVVESIKIKIKCEKISGLIMLNSIEIKNYDFTFFN